MSSIEETIRRIVREEVRAALHNLQLAAGPPSSEDMDELMSLRAAAALLGIAEGTLRDWRVDRKGPPATRCGRLVKYRRAELEKWVTAEGAGRRPLAVQSGG